MSNANETTTQKNIANALGVISYNEFVLLNEEEKRKVIASARKKLRFKDELKSQGISRVIFPSGNPYIILGKKVNRKGKLVK